MVNSRDGWSYDPKGDKIENYWGSLLLLADRGQHLSFEELSKRIDPAYLGYAVEKRGLKDEEARQHATELDHIWDSIADQDSQPLETFPRIGIETPVSSSEPAFCLRALIWDRLSRMNFPSFVNPYFHWGRVPNDEEDLKPWEWPSDEQRQHYQQLQDEEIEQQHDLGNVWFGREFNTSALPQVVELRPDLVERWLAGGRDQLRLASTFYEGLCGVLLRPGRRS